MKKQSRRSFTVLASLVGVLTLTSVILRAMQGAPLTADAASSLMATESRAALDVIFNTQVPLQTNRWTTIFIHHSRTPGGSARPLAGGKQPNGDHFVIGNGLGAIDGEIQVTPLWNQQLAADPTPGFANIEPSCISICIVGDFDKTAPTPTQLMRLEHLVQALQDHLRIPESGVWMFDRANSPAGRGRYFPSSAFQGQLLR